MNNKTRFDVFFFPQDDGTVICELRLNGCVAARALANTENQAEREAHVAYWTAFGNGG
jgi:hypothetical protein